MSSSEVHRELLVKKQGNVAYFSVHPAVYQPYTLLTRQSVKVLKGGVDQYIKQASTYLGVP